MSFRLYTREELLGSPSCVDGLDSCAEKRLRNGYCDLISGAGAELKLPQYVVACAIFLCHHFFAIKSMRRNDRFLIATACLFLGCKMEDRIQNIKDVITACYIERFGPDSGRVLGLKDPSHMRTVRALVLDAEKIILQETGFSFVVDLPYNHSLNLLEMLPLDHLRGDRKLKLIQLVWDLINDSLRTTLALQYSARAIAAGMVSVALTFMKETCGTKRIWEGVQEGQMVEGDIRQQMMDLYNLPRQSRGDVQME